MDRTRLFDVLDGLYAYDTGSTDSGIKDENLRQEIIGYLESLDDNEFRITMSKFIREYFISDEALKKGYGIEDVAAFIKWLDRYMDIQL